MPIITVENVYKGYRLGTRDDTPDTLVSSLLRTIRQPVSAWRKLRSSSEVEMGETGDNVLWALSDVSFQINEGDVVGIMGRNGAGKSTFLKIVSRITEPTSGKITLRGRVSSLLEVGTGFHPELTGRENIYMNGTLLGMRKKEIDSKLEEIIAFSGVEKFIDTPTKRYSSGMQVRLAFAVAAHLEPEILVIDEVLAVGDMEFQRKCLGKMQSVARGGRTVLFVSHNMAAVENLCTRGIVFNDGRMICNASTGEALHKYMNLNQGSEEVTTLSQRRRDPGLNVIIRELRVLDQDNNPSTKILAGTSMKLEIVYEHVERLLDPAFCITILNDWGVKIISPQSRQQFGAIAALPGQGKAECVIQNLPLVPGRYFISVACQINRVLADCVHEAITFDVLERDVFGTGRIPTAQSSVVFSDAIWTFS